MDNSVRTLRIKNKSIFFVSMVLIGFQIVFDERVWLLSAIGFNSALVLSFIWARGLKKGLWLKRKKQFGWAKVGEPLQERFEMGNESRFPATWVTVFDQSNFPGYTVDTARSMEPRSMRRWIKSSIFTKRGYYVWGPTSAVTSDPFGIFEVEIFYPEVQNVLVVPPIIPLPFIKIAVGDKAGEGGLKMYAPERTITAATVRDYVPGDDLHTVHWLTSARRDDLYVRVFDHTPSSDWWIIVDLDDAVQRGQELDATDEYGIIMAASIADKGIRDGRAVGLVAAGNRYLWLPPKTGNTQRWEILHSLATTERGTTPFDSVLAGTQRALGRNESVILITSSLSQAWIKMIVPLQQRNIAITVLWVDPSEFGGETLETQSILAQLAAWGVNYYRITPNIYHQPEFFSPWGLGKRK